jgi:hypothetical protein
LDTIRIAACIALMLALIVTETYLAHEVIGLATKLLA